MKPCIELSHLSEAQKRAYKMHVFLDESHRIKSGLSAGIAYASFELLEIVVARRPVSFKDLRWTLGNIGPIPTAKVLENALGMGWVGHDDDGAAVPTASGEKLLAIGAPAGRLRQAILDYIDIEEPFWLQTANFGRAKLLRFAGPAIGQIFLEAVCASAQNNNINYYTVRLP
ncbi:hypothetical protein [Candidatus Nitrotoga fabula]|uniref:Uncharacterized protein n=1 Tax=Candidatus Nitrotoga fabula TaxID=2182327 RepID=A0A916BD89_9PROT|nr:hypothetical protein [Candidatus Nitrotoga fabula]CAE6729993.1 hypothetical protein NTGZN8_430002 [Candidatus Nitrotoga fabula]